jgi:hypothetical protein
MSIISFLSLNNEEITEQGRKMTDSINVNAGQVELDNGASRRYIKKNKRSFTFQWDWLPSLDTHTIDNRRGRDYVKSLALTVRNKILMEIKMDHNEDAELIYVYGPTEVTIAVSLCRLSQLTESQRNMTEIPIGKSLGENI